MDFWISDWISGFHSGFLDFSLDFWISAWISGFLDSVWISADGVRDFFRDGPLDALPKKQKVSSRGQSKVIWGNFGKTSGFAS